MARKTAEKTPTVPPGGQFVLLVRHGIAQPRTEKKADEARSLTATGHQRMKVIGKSLARWFPKAEVIYTSPLLRAVQTAEWIARGYHHEVRTEITDTLLPGASPGAVLKLLASSGAAEVICVGHEPSLSALLLHLTGMQADGPLELKKGGCYGVRFVAGERARLELMLPPGILRRR